jgi:hypothetical protein
MSDTSGAAASCEVAEGKSLNAKEINVIEEQSVLDVVCEKCVN